LNRASAEAVIRQSLEKTSDVSVMLMLDIDNFKNFNDTYGHSYGDKVISTVADTLRSFFRREDIVARMGGDEFAAFLCNVTDIKLIKDKAHRLCKSMREIEIDGKNAEITCSVGMSVSTEENRSFEVLYQNADKALYSAKCKGKNAVSIYGEEQETTSIISWINDTESVLDAINDRIYICDRNNYDLLYVNDCVCQSAGVTREQCRGKKCYELLMHKTAPCEFCSMSKMSESKVYARLFKMPNSSQVFLMRGKNIHRNGMAAHLELAVDVTKIEGMRLEFEAADNE
ncbi:MAG: diguanylate cyclase, partial [Oscillospiraceae bacterium]